MAPAPKLLYVVNEAYFFLSHRLAVAEAARDAGYEVMVAAPADHVWAPEGFSASEFERRGFQLFPIPLSRRGKNPIAEARTLAALFRLYRRLAPDLVHHLTIKPLLYGGIAARLARVPAVVNSVTGLGQAFLGTGAGAGALRRLILTLYAVAAGHPNCRFTVQNREDSRVLTAAAAVRADQIRLISGSGVALGEFTPSAEPNGVPVVVFASRLIWEKGVAEFVEAAAELRRRGVAARFVLAGDTRPEIDQAVPRDQLDRWTAEGVVEWTGRRDDMAALLATAHVFCLPSKYGEGVPKVLIEAAASGLPIVTTDIPGCRDVVRDGENGFLVPTGDAMAVADALAKLLDDEALRRRFGARSREAAAAFAVEKVVDDTLALYRELERPRVP